MRPLASAAAGAILAGLLAAGCAQGPAGPPRPSVESCAEFGITAIKHRVTVTSLPAACRGLTRAQVNLAVGQALYAMTSNVHGKAERRARARELSPLLGRLVTTVPAQRSLPSAPAPAAGHASGPSLGLAALISWLITVGLGSWMMARWITRGGFRRARLSQAGLPPSLIFTHFGLAVAGLLAWGAYLATGLAAAAWTGCVLLLPVAGLGMALVSLWLPERSLATATVAATQAVPAGAGATPGASPAPGVVAPAGMGTAPGAGMAPGAGTAPGVGTPPGAGTAPGPVGPDPPPARHPPTLIVAAHGVFAVATILFALLAAVGSH
jgi:manganese efflux pump family protein